MAPHTPIVSELNELLMRLEGLLEEGRRLPWTRRVLVDEDELRTLLNQIGHVIPEEMRQARWIVQERDRILAEAGQEADDIRDRARQEAVSRAAESERVREAKAQAEQIIAEAKAHAQEIRVAGRHYLDGQLAQLEARMADLLATVHANRAELQD
ncbi:MAG: ATPase [Thermaerobacter sp.]|nr:ATPase [Thermaerobacter sp.]